MGALVHHVGMRMTVVKTAHSRCGGIAPAVSHVPLCHMVMSTPA